jgi:hypothetical protein
MKTHKYVTQSTNKEQDEEGIGSNMTQSKWLGSVSETVHTAHLACVAASAVSIDTEHGSS